MDLSYISTISNPVEVNINELKYAFDVQVPKAIHTKAPTPFSYRPIYIMRDGAVQLGSWIEAKDKPSKLDIVYSIEVRPWKAVTEDQKHIQDMCDIHFAYHVTQMPIAIPHIVFTKTYQSINIFISHSLNKIRFYPPKFKTYAYVEHIISSPKELQTFISKHKDYLIYRPLKSNTLTNTADYTFRKALHDFKVSVFIINNIDTNHQTQYATENKDDDV